MDKGVEKRGQYNHKKIEPFLPVRKERAYGGWLVYAPGLLGDALCPNIYSILFSYVLYTNQHTSVGHNHCKYW